MLIIHLKSICCSEESLDLEE